MISNNPQQIFDIENKVIILTGSAGRLGSRFAEILCIAGAKIVLVDINKTSNKKLQKQLQKKYKNKPLEMTIDLTSEKQVKSMVKQVVKKFGTIDCLINNAHVYPRNHKFRDAPFEKYPLDLWDSVTTQNLRSIFFCCREVGKVMIKKKNGIIINISSIYGILGADQRIYGRSRLNSPVSYAVTKGAIVNLTRYLAAYWQGKNIRVNTLTIGGVYDKKLHKNKNFVRNYSKKTMLSRMAKKEDLDGPILFLASNASSYITGANLIVDGGYSVW